MLTPSEPGSSREVWRPGTLTLLSIRVLRSELHSSLILRGAPSGESDNRGDQAGVSEGVCTLSTVTSRGSLVSCFPQLRLPGR